MKSTKKKKQPTWKVLLQAAFEAATLALILATLVGFLGRFWFVFDIFSHFRVQYLWLLALFAVIHVLLKKYDFAAAAFVFVLVNLVIIWPYWFAAAPQNPGGETYRVMFANIFFINDDLNAIVSSIRSTDADTVFLAEVEPPMFYDLKEELVEYGFGEYASGEGAFGIAAFSRTPITDAAVYDFGDLGSPTVQLVTKLGDKEISVNGTHLYTPMTNETWKKQNTQLDGLADHMAQLDKPGVLVGDFNNTPFSPRFQAMLERGKLTQGRIGFGLQPSWPVLFPAFMRIPLDQTLVTEGVVVTNRTLGERTGSDHYPVIVDFTVTE